MAKRVCAEPSCPTIISTGTRCTPHTRARDAARGRRQARGYDHEYDRAVAAMHRTNPTHCATCGQPFTPTNPATGGHRIALRDGGTTDDGIEAQCRRCNYGWRRTGN